MIFKAVGAIGKRTIYVQTVENVVVQYEAEYSTSSKNFKKIPIYNVLIYNICLTFFIYTTKVAIGHRAFEISITH